MKSFRKSTGAGTRGRCAPDGSCYNVRMASRWKGRIEKLGRANREAREAALRALTPRQSRAVLEGLLSHPVAKPRKRAGHPVSLSRRMRRADV